MRSAISLAAGAALFFAAANAQAITYPNGTVFCSIPNASYCAGDSLVTNIILRCNGTVGQPGNCNDNLAGEPPLGVNYSPCYQTSPISGDAACSKNGIVYGPNGTFPVPGTGNSPTSSFASASFSTISASAAASITVTSTSVAVATSAVTATGTVATVTMASATPSQFTGAAAAIHPAGLVLGAVPVLAWLL